MTIKEALQNGISKLLRATDHRDSAALDAEILLARALGVEREQIYIRSGDMMPKRALAIYRGYLARRARHEPVAYILGEKEFFGLRLKVNRNVLIPRPETEILIDLVLSTFDIPHSKFQIIDVGTGSGAIAIALAKNLPNAKIVATDISSKALNTARSNAKCHGLSRRIRFIKSNLLSLVPNPKSQIPTILVANLPYLPTAVWKKTTPEIRRYEPRQALDGGRDGLYLYRKLLEQMKGMNWSAAFFEIDPFQQRKIIKIIRQYFLKSKTEFFKKSFVKISRQK